MTVVIKLNPFLDRDVSIIIGDHGRPDSGSLFFPVESAHAVSGTHGVKQGRSAREPIAVPSRLVISHYAQTFNNEASWTTSVKEQLAELAYRSQIIVGQTEAGKSGTGDSIAASGSYAKLTDAGATFAVTDVYRTIAITGSVSAANDGVFIITEFIDVNNIVYNNTNFVVEAVPAATWTIEGVKALTPTEIRAL